MKLKSILLVSAAIAGGLTFQVFANEPAAVPAPVSDASDSFKSFTYEQRADFIASLDHLAENLRDQALDLNARLTGRQDAASAERNRKMKELNQAHSDLEARIADLAKATPATWAEAKGKATQSWLRVQAAYDRVRAGLPS